MRIQKFNKTQKFQDGGAISAGDPSMQGGAPVGAEMQQAEVDQDAMMQQLAQVANNIISQMGPEAAAMLAQMIMEMLQSGQQQVGAPQEGEPVFKKGGKICGRVKKGKMNKGGKC